MAAIAWTDVVALAADLSTVPTLGQTIILAHVNLALDPVVFGGESHAKLKLARVLYAAHLGKMSQLGSSGGGTSGGGGGTTSGPVTSESVGGISRSYANLVSGGGSSGGGSGGGGDFTGTTYGIMLNSLINSCAAARLPVVI